MTVHELAAWWADQPDWLRQLIVASPMLLVGAGISVSLGLPLRALPDIRRFGVGYAPIATRNVLDEDEAASAEWTSNAMEAVDDLAHRRGRDSGAQ